MASEGGNRMNYYNIATKWWSKELRESAKIQHILLSEIFLMNLESNLARLIKTEVEEVGFMVLHSRAEAILLISAAYKHWQPLFPDIQMLVTPNLVLVRQSHIWKYKRFDKPFVETDLVLYQG